MSSETKIQLLERERAAHDHWWSTLAEVPPDASRPDGWTLNDVVAHVSAWQRYSAGRIGEIAQNGDDPGPPRDEDRFNEEARLAAGAWEETRREAAEAHRALLELVASLPEARVFADDGLIEFIVRVNGSGHYEEHPASEFAV
jgi:hypothetical protein